MHGADLETDLSGEAERLHLTYALLVSPLSQYPVDKSQIYPQAFSQNVTLLSYVHLQFMIEKGVTILFVSQDINIIRSLCKKAILLDKGEIIMFGPSHEVALNYRVSIIKNDQTL